MRRHSAAGRFATIATAATALACLGLAATPAGAATEQLRVLAVDTTNPPEVAITVASPAAFGGRPLPPEAFRLEEGGRLRRPRVEQISNEGLEVVMVLDTSGSMEGAPIASAKDAAQSFLGMLPPGASIGVVAFGAEPYVVHEPSVDRQSLSAAIESLRAAGDTALFDAAIAGAAQLSADTSKRRVVVVLSDGGDTASTATLDDATGTLSGSAVTVYGVSLLTGESDPAALAQLAAVGGGRVVAASDPSALAALYEDLAREIVSQYRIVYEAVTRGTTTVRLTLDLDGVSAAAQFDVSTDTARVDRPVVVTAERPTSVEPGLFGRGWAATAGVVLAGAALVLLGLLVLRPRERQRRLSARDARAVRERTPFGDAMERASTFAERQLARRGRQSDLAGTLERAGVDLRPGEFLVMVFGTALLVAVVALALLGPLVGLAAAALTVVAFRLAVARRETRRRARFAEQLGDALQLMTGTLRAGHGVVQAVNMVAQEAEEPTRTEFRRIVVETRLGKGLLEALDAAADRVRNEDFRWVVQAIAIHREVGGDLAEVLDHVAATIRDRNRVKRQISSLSAEGRLSAVILFVLPIAMFGLIAIVNSSYLSELTTTTEGQVMLAVGVVLMIVGALWMRRLIRLVF